MLLSEAFDKQGYFFSCAWLKQEVYMLYISIIFQGNVNTISMVSGDSCYSCCLDWEPFSFMNTKSGVR